MHSKYLNLGIIICISILSGCATTTGDEALGTTNQQKLSQEIVVGKTTKNDVNKIFGAPTNTSYTDSGNLIWFYQFSHMRMEGEDYIPLSGWFYSGMVGKKKTLTILFDDKNVVKKYSMDQSPLHITSGLFSH